MIGKYIFRCPTFRRLPGIYYTDMMLKVLAEYAAHDGQCVTVLMKVPMRPPRYRIMADDGWKGFAFKDELHAEKTTNRD